VIYQRDDLAAEILKLTGGRGADLVFDATYSERGFGETAKTLRQGGRWIVLGVGPGKTTRVAETIVEGGHRHAGQDGGDRRSRLGGKKLRLR
jgi:threonine dehydrogenase-like Zn-dependent dehydrogenase